MKREDAHLNELFQNKHAGLFSHGRTDTTIIISYSPWQVKRAETCRHRLDAGAQHVWAPLVQWPLSCRAMPMRTSPECPGMCGKMCDFIVQLGKSR